MPSIGQTVSTKGMVRMRAGRGVALIVLVLVAGCSSGDSSSNGGQRSTAPSSSSTQAAEHQPILTKRLDAIAVLGHSGATGTLSDPKNPSIDAHQNSWATGDNPKVQSVYLRLLKTHPAMKGHNYNEAINGTTVYDLDFELQNLLTDAKVLPDVILIQTIDNDMQCDGSDPQNYKPFGRRLDRSLGQMEKKIPGVQFFLVSQWATVQNWATWAVHHEEQVAANSGTGPCDVFDGKGKLRPAGITSMQKIVDSYWAQVEKVCAAHLGCFTDHGAEQEQFHVTDADVAMDLNHLSVAGHRKFAAVAWQAFPDQVKQRP